MMDARKRATHQVACAVETLAESSCSTRSSCPECRFPVGQPPQQLLFPRRPRLRLRRQYFSGRRVSSDLWQKFSVVTGDRPLLGIAAAVQCSAAPLSFFIFILTLFDLFLSSATRRSYALSLDSGTVSRCRQMFLRLNFTSFRTFLVSLKVRVFLLLIYYLLFIELAHSTIESHNSHLISHAVRSYFVTLAVYTQVLVKDYKYEYTVTVYRSSTRTSHTLSLVFKPHVQWTDGAPRAHPAVATHDKVSSLHPEHLPSAAHCSLLIAHCLASLVSVTIMF